MGRWRALSSSSLLLFKQIKSSLNPIKSTQFIPKPVIYPSFLKENFRCFSANPWPNSIDDDYDYSWGSKRVEEDEDKGKIPIKAYFLSTSIDLKSMQAENSRNVVPAISRSSNYIALKYCDIPPKLPGKGVKGTGTCCRYMVVFQYGSAVLFNVEESEVDSYLNIARNHASGLLSEMRKDDYAVIEKPLLTEDMQGGPDYIVLKSLDTDGIRIISSVLGQSIALDYFVSQVDGMLEEFTDINRAMEETGTFTMERKKLFQLVGKANSNLADVIWKVGIFDRSEIAWRDAKYAQILEYLREEYEVTQRFGNLDFKLKFVEHNIHFLQEALQNRKSNILVYCMITLLSIQNVVSVCEIIHDLNAANL